MFIMAKRKPFGGVTISFARCGCTTQDVFGKAAMPPSAMTKKLWKHVKTAHGRQMMKR